MDTQLNNNHRKSYFLDEKVVSNIMKVYLGSVNCRLIHYTTKKASESMIGFLGEYWKLHMEVEINGTNWRNLYFFIKSIPRHNESKAKMLLEIGLFDKEKFVYNNILSRFEEYHDVQRFHARLVASTDFDLIFENLSALGYIMKDKLQYFDLDHCRTALTSLARFHSQSIIYEERASKRLGKVFRLHEHYPNQLDRGGYIFDHAWYNNCMRGALYAIEHYSKTYGETTDYFAEIRKKWPEIWKEALDLCDASTELRNVMCHRDLWCNNILFHYGPDAAPDGCVFVDFQAVRVQPPAGDVMLLLYANLDRHVRNNHVTDLTKYYYNALNELLATASIEITEIIPWDQFIKSCHEQIKWGIIATSCLIPQNILNDQKLKDYFSTAENFEYILTVNKESFIDSMMKCPLYKNRILDLLEEIVERYVLGGDTLGKIAVVNEN